MFLHHDNVFNGSVTVWWCSTANLFPTIVKLGYPEIKLKAANSLELHWKKKHIRFENTPHLCIHNSDISQSILWKSSISRGHSIEVPIETFFDLETLTYDLD